jgi:hypothetical protein
MADTIKKAKGAKKGLKGKGAAEPAETHRC